MKLTDMNLICIEECFEYLELKDLLSVADANKRLRRAAEFIFIRKYSKGPVFILIDKKIEYKYSPPNAAIELKGDLKTSFQLLRCFGHMITDVEFFFSGSYGGDHCFEQRLLDQLNEYCADSLINFYLRVDIYREEKCEMFTKPFTRAEKVSIVNCHLFERGKEFSSLFPKVKELEYSLLKEHVVGHYPHLEYLSTPKTEHTTSLLHLNPQLKKLHIFSISKDNCDEFTLRNFIEPMENLEELELHCYGDPFANFVGNKIESKSIKKFAISSGNRQKYPFLFDQLEQLDINTYPMLTSHVYDFIDQHPTITKLNICGIINFSRISKALPSLIELHYIIHDILMSENFSVDDFFCCVSSFGSLKKLCFQRYCSTWHTFYDELQARMAESPLADRWRLRMSLNLDYSDLSSFILERLDHQTSQ